MRLQEFITETLKELIKGVKDAQCHAAEAGGAINPTGLNYLPGSGAAVQHKNTTRIGQEIEFDIEVSATDGKTSQGKGEIFVGMIGLGVQGKSESANRSVNSIKFKIPVIFPKMQYIENQDEPDQK